MLIINPSDIEILKKRRLRLIRQATFKAIDKGEKQKIAKLTMEAAQLNQAIHQAEGLVIK